MIIVANWKAIVADLHEAKRLVAAAQNINRGKSTVIVAPPFPFIAELALPKPKLAFAGQDISAQDAGSHTGEVTGAALKEAGARYVIIGHSERRARGETDAEVAVKTKKALAAGLTPIVCVGERERDSDAEYLAFVRREIDAVYEGLSKKEAGKIMLAYEPVWAIGKSAESALNPEDLVEMVGYIRKVVAQHSSKKEADSTPILYGGSVDETNVHALTHETGVVGVLVGRASTTVKTFSSLAQALSHA